MSRHKKVTSILLHTLLTVLAVIWLIPVFWLVLSSFRAEKGAYTSNLWPKAFTFDNYVRLFTDTRLFDFPRWFMNTLFVAVCSCVITTVLTLMVAYVYSRLRFKSRKGLMNISLVLGLFPGFMSMIAIYHFMKAIGLDQTLLALILVYSGGAAAGGPPGLVAQGGRVGGPASTPVRGTGSPRSDPVTRKGRASGCRPHRHPSGAYLRGNLRCQDA